MAGRPLDLASGHRMTDNRGVVVSNGALHPAVIAALADQAS
jgi:3'(2'), 5'-bisphosphate nucleotidase